MYHWPKLKFNAKHCLPFLLLPLTAGHANAANDNAEVRPGTVVFKKVAGVSASELKGLNALLKSQGLVDEITLDGSQITIATFNGKGREKAIANILKHSGLVEFAEPDYAVQPSVQPNDSSFGSQWHHSNINSPNAWDITTGGSVLVGVCDTGFDTDHPDLAANLRADLAYNAQDDSTYIEDFNGHGTGTAGSLGAVGNNGTGVAGVNWNVEIIPVRIAISDTNSGAYISTMAKCIEYAADNGARVVNVSYGGIQYASIDAAAQYLRARNGLLFMSAGNSGQEYPSFPDYTSFIGVGATNQSDTKASFSDWGDYVDITAPGVSILTTYKNASYISYSGTSFSSPVAAGVAALMVAANPSITVEELENGIFLTATDIGANGDDNVYGHGLINAQAAVEYANSLGDYTAPVAQISASDSAVPFGSAVSFSAANSYDADGSVVSYKWNFGDGTTSTQMDTTHTYAAAGVYQVSLSVTDNDGLTGVSTTSVQVTNDLPVAVIDAVSSDYLIGETVYLSATGSYDNDGTIVDYQWEFGNGDSLNGEVVEYAYPSGGTYTVILTVTDNAGSFSTDTLSVTVADPLALSAPANLSATTDNLDVLLSWQDNNSSETLYTIERGEKFRGKTRFEVVATLGADSESFTDTVPATGDYSYRVTVQNDGYEVTSETIKVTVADVSSDTVLPSPGALAVPSDLTVSQSGNNISLAWTDNSDDESGFYLERGIKAKGSIEFVRIAVVAAGITTFTDDTSAISTGSYGYRVMAFNDSEQSDYSNTAELRIK